MATILSSGEMPKTIWSMVIFYTSETPPGSDHHLFFFDEDVRGGMNKYQIDYNLWHMPDPLWSVTISNQFSSLEERHRETGQSQNGAMRDPLFAEIANGAFSLTKASPAVNKGIESLRVTDFFGNPHKNFPDLGALELQY